MKGDVLDNLKFQWSLVGFFLFATCAALVVLLAVERQLVLSREGERLAGQAYVIEQNMERQIAATRAALGAVLDDWVFFASIPDGRELSDYRLRSLAGAMPGVRTILVLTDEGRVLSSNRAELIGRDFSERDYVRAVHMHPSSETLYVSRPFRTVLDVFALNMTRASLSADTQPENIVTATLDPTFFSILMESVRYAPDMWVAIAHGDGMLFNHAPPNEQLLGTDLARPDSLFSRHVNSGENATLIDGVVATTGVRTLIAQRTIAPDALQMDKPLVVAVARNREAIFAPWRQKAIALAGLWCVLVLVSISGVMLYQRRQRAEEAVRQIAFNDPLTGLPNRRLLVDRMRQEQAASIRHQRLSALLFVDLDHFKALNDTLGHDRGDEFLQRLSRNMRACVREEDTVARLGGDEFVVMLSALSPDLKDAGHQAFAVAEKILQLVRTDPLSLKVEPHCSASIGITLFGGRPERVEDIIKRADMAMYKVKTAGRDGVEVLDSVL